jgi:hypothetical protein
MAFNQEANDRIECKLQKCALPTYAFHWLQLLEALKRRLTKLARGLCVTRQVNLPTVNLRSKYNASRAGFQD